MMQTGVVCTDDGVLPVDYQRRSAELMADRVEILADHSPFVSATDSLVDSIVAAATR